MWGQNCTEAGTSLSWKSAKMSMFFVKKQIRPFIHFLQKMSGTKIFKKEQKRGQAPLFL